MLDKEEQFQDILLHFLDSRFLSVKERIGLLFAKKLTLEVNKMETKDHKTLVEAGYTDEEILHLVEVISYFNFVNRLAEGLGVEMEIPDNFKLPETKKD